MLKTHCGKVKVFTPDPHKPEYCGIIEKKRLNECFFTGNVKYMFMYRICHTIPSVGSCYNKHLASRRTIKASVKETNSEQSAKKALTALQ